MSNRFYHSDHLQLIIENKLQQISDPKVIEAICLEAMKNQAKAVKQYQKGKQKAIFAIAGEIAKVTDQRANMKSVIKCLEKLLKPK